MLALILVAVNGSFVDVGQAKLGSCPKAGTFSKRVIQKARAGQNDAGAF